MRRLLLVSVAVCIVVAVAGSAGLAAGYRGSVGTGADQIPVVVVSGTPYEMGFSYGKLMATEIKACMGRFLSTAQAQDAARGAARRESNEQLDAAWAKVEPSINPRFIEEMKGMCDGAGIKYEDVRRAHSIPLVEDYSCSEVAVWGPASANGHLYQIRNLDWSTDLGLQDYPVIVVYYPQTGVPHVNVAFAGYVGCISGMSAEGITLSEKGATPESDYPFKLQGVPFWVLFRDILQDSHSLADARKILETASRHKKYYYTIGDGDIPAALKVRAFAPGLDIWTDNDPKDEVAPKVRQNFTYVTMKDDLAWKHLNDNYGKYDPAKMVELSRLVGTDGALHYVVFDATAREMWVANAEGNQVAKDRTYVHFKLADFPAPKPDQVQK